MVSVVVPVYNVERYIARCIESILNQTHRNLELILVDDGSPDRSGEICDEYALKDPRVTVIHTPNGGVSHARNTGMQKAKGTYLFFVDSDDWLEPEHIEVLLPIEDEDLVYGGRKYFRKGEFVKKSTPRSLVLESRTWLSDYSGFVGKGLTIFFVAGCYKMELIRQNDLSFQTGLHIAEDGLFNIGYLACCRKIRYSDTSTYCYEDANDTSLSNSFHAQRLDAETVKLQAVEAMTGKKEYMIRWNEWCAICRHYRKWLTFADGIHRKEAGENLLRAYRSEYFRESIPYVRQQGSLDQKLETFFMRKWLHPLYKPCYGVVAALYGFKNLFIKK